MGIRNLNKLINQDCKHLFDTVPLSTFAGESIAIDLSIVIHKCHSVEMIILTEKTDLLTADIDETILLKRTTKAVLNWISKNFVSHKIRPIIVTEGKTPALKKLYALPQRKKIREEAKSRLGDLLSQLEKDGATRDTIEGEFTTLTSLKCRSRQLTSKMRAAIITSIAEKGYPIVQATGEAEELCTKLCLEGLVAAVFSTDTDNLVRRCPMLITAIRWDHSLQQLMAHTARYSPEIHTRSGLNYTEFVDYCIMAGCDYNTRFSRMREPDMIEYLYYYGSIENIEAKLGLDLSCLNYQECRKLFMDRPLKDCCASYDELRIAFPGKIKE